MTQTLFTPTTLGKLQLKNRVVMAPMTRCRAVGNVPNELMEKYYAERASAGLIISEGVAPSANGMGYARQPGLFTEAQVQGWKRVNDGVHAAGGKIFVQLMHDGRVSHPANMLPGTKVIAPSAIAAPGEMWTDSSGMQAYPVPVPSSGLLSSFDSVIQPIIAQLKSLSFANQKLRAARDLLLPRLMSGEIAV